MTTEQLVIPLSEIERHVGERVGPSGWVTITQGHIDGFAEVTGDHQWIHVDPERAALESPWKTTIAHGYLTLSLVPTLLMEVLRIEGYRTAVNTGIDKIRLATPVPAGARVRLGAEIRDVRALPRDGVRVTFAVRFEVEGAPKPALFGNVTYVYFP